MTTVELTLPYPPAALSPNSRASWQVKAAATKHYRFACFIQGATARSRHWEKFPIRPTPVIAIVTFIVITDRKRDEDNALASIKALWDGLVDALVLRTDDSTALHVECAGFIKGQRAKVRVRLEGTA